MQPYKRAKPRLFIASQFVGRLVVQPTQKIALFFRQSKEADLASALEEIFQFMKALFVGHLSAVRPTFYSGRKISPSLRVVEAKQVAGQHKCALEVGRKLACPIHTATVYQAHFARKLRPPSFFLFA